MNKNILILGGDLRNVELHNLLEDEADITGFDSLSCVDTIKFETAMENLSKYKYIVLPVPYCTDDIIKMPYSSIKLNKDECLEQFTSEQTVYLGALTPVVSKAHCVNLLSDPGYALQNAHLTALICASLLVAKYGVDLKDSKILVLGYGKVGKYLCEVLKSMGACVFAAARKPADKADILLKYDGYLHIYDLEKDLDKFDVIINTVPFWVISKRELKYIPKRCLLIELASKPFGFDFDEAVKQDRYVHMEPSLPGNYTPRAEAKNIAYIIKKDMEE